MLKRVCLMLLFVIFLQSCLLMPVDMSEMPGSHSKEGDADYYPSFDMGNILNRDKVLTKIGKYNVMLPEKTIFKYGSTAYGTDEIFGKKRKYFYDEISKLGSEIYLIEDTFEKISKNGRIYNEKNGRYKISGGYKREILIKIKSDLYLVCKSEDIKAWNSYIVKSSCEDLIKVMQEGVK